MTPHLSYLSTTVKSAGVSTTSSGIANLGAQYEYGVNDMVSFYGNLAFATLSGGSNSQSGLQDPTVGVKGTSAMGMGNIRYGAELLLGFQKTTNSNVAGGGFAISPYVGYDMVAGPGMLGFRLLDKVPFTRTSDGPNGDRKTTGGNVLSLAAYYEYMLSDMILGGKLNYDVMSDTTISQNNLPDSGGANGGMFGVGLYSRVPMGMGALLAGVDYTTHTGDKLGGSSIDSLNAFAINVGYRLMF